MYYMVIVRIRFGLGLLTCNYAEFIINYMYMCNQDTLKYPPPPAPPAANGIHPWGEHLDSSLVGCTLLTR